MPRFKTRTAKTRTAKTKAARVPQAIAPEPCLPGTTGAVGIDVSKANFHVCYLAGPKARPQTGVFSSDAQGHTKFLRWLDRVGASKSVHICLEETGCYGRALGAFLHEAGHHVSIVNAALIKNFGASLNLRTKTDAVDARLIAQYTVERVPARWAPLAPAHQALRDATRRREQVMGLITQEKNHLEASPSEAVSRHIGRTIELLEGELRAIKALMDEIVESDPQLKHNATLLDSIPGIAELTATLLLAELPPLDSFQSARQLCAYAGLTPRQRKSGTSVNGKSRLCKQGRGGLRRLLFMPAMSLMGSKSGPLRKFADQLLAASKTPACVVGALMRKLMALAFAILRSGVAFDPNYHRTLALASTRK